MRAGDLGRAMALARDALDRGHSDPVIHNLRSYWHESEGRAAEALADLERASALAPGDPRILNGMARCLTALGRFHEAVAACDAAIALDQTLAAAHYNRGFALELSARLEEAKQAYELALKFAPGMTDAVARLSGLAARRSDWAVARSLADRALAANPQDSIAQFALVMADMGEHRYGDAERRARQVAADEQAIQQARVNAHSFLADALHAQGLIDEAFAEYQTANSGLKDLFRERFEAPGVETGQVLVRRWQAEFEAVSPAAWKSTPSGGPDPVFIIGFPRSGTTLLGQILASHSQVETLVEKPLLQEVNQAFMIEPGQMGKLAELGGTELDRYRGLYWSHASEYGATGRLLVDQSPFDTLYLPVIAKLFPKAKIVFALRDPRDVVLSCFRRLFVPNTYVYEFLDLMTAAQFYDCTMRLGTLYREMLPLSVLEVKNEELVSDFEGTTRRLCAFLDLDWSPALADFAQRSKARAIATPSATQVAKGISGDGVGQWRRYGKYMADVLPLLAPWVDNFGYNRHG